MRKALFFVLAPALMLAQTPAAQQVAEAERAFAKEAAAKGIRPAFLDYLSEDSLVLQPQLASGRKAYGEGPEDKGELSWGPEQVGASAAGDLAYSTGPWEYRISKTAKEPLVAGHFLSIWQRQADGAWKVAFDCGVSHPAGAPGALSVFMPYTQDRAMAVQDAVARKSSDGGLRGVEDALAERCVSPRGMAAVADALAFGGTVYRTRRGPLTGRAEVLDALSAEGARRFTLQGVQVSRSLDLGYTWGSAESLTTPARHYTFLRVWAMHSELQFSGWTLLFDLEQALPEEKK